MWELWEYVIGATDPDFWGGRWGRLSGEGNAEMRTKAKYRTGKSEQHLPKAPKQEGLQWDRG